MLDMYGYLVLIIASVVSLIVAPFKLQVSHIECLSTSTIEVHFIANQSTIDLTGKQVDFVLNDVSYVTDYFKHTGDAYHFSAVFSVTEPFTYTISEAYIQVDPLLRVYAHNIPYDKYLNCNPTAVDITSFTANSMSIVDVLIYFLAALGLAASIIIIYRLYKSRK